MQERLIFGRFDMPIWIMRPPEREIIDVDYVEITDDGEIYHTIDQKLIKDGKDDTGSDK